MKLRNPRSEERAALRAELKEATKEVDQLIDQLEKALIREVEIRQKLGGGR